MKGVISFYLPQYPSVLVYMLQNTEYQAGPYLRWYWRTTDFSKVMKRRELHKTKSARLLLLALRLGMLLQILTGLFFIWLWVGRHLDGTWQFGVSLLISYPIIWAHLIVLPLVAGRIFIAKPKERRLVAQSKAVFARHKGTKIAVAGSYGKTTMKELLGVVLSEGKNVAITPANKNVAISHAIFASQLKGDEDILVIEYGEGQPGDVARYAETTQPNMGVITGIAPAHLDQYPTLDDAARDIFSLAEYLHNKNVYVNHDSIAARRYMNEWQIAYSAAAVGDWKIGAVKVDFDGVRFTMKKGKDELKLHSDLLGRHQVGPLAAVAAIAHQLGLSKKQIEEGIRKTSPFEHRMQPRVVGGAWIIDDTYNGNIDGIKAGLALLKELPGNRKVYVTPGLVDQGVETETVHKEMGRLIAATNPTKVVLMDNSVTGFIQAGLEEAEYAGEVSIEDDPLGFYTGLEHLVAAGDIWLLQNDWTDNYA